MTTQKPEYIIGSISWGTMREEDLVPTFLDAIKHFNPSQWRELRKEYEEIMNLPEADCQEQLSYFLNETLFDTLNEYAPPYFYFGAHPGDGADYGFWLAEDALQDFDGLKVSDLSEVPSDYSGEVLQVNDHGNTSLYVANNGKLETIWEIV